MSTRIRLAPTATCQAQPVMCGWAVTRDTYREVYKLAVKHYKRTGHAVRVEQINTELVGFSASS